MKKILVPIDNDKRSVSALEYAAMFASSLDSQIIALHVVDPKKYRSKKDFQNEVDQLVKKQLRPKLEKIHENFQDIRTIKLQVLGKCMSLHEHIVNYSEAEDIDLIILGSHGVESGNEWELSLTKSNVYKVILKSQVPVFSFGKPPESSKIRDILVPIDLMEGSLYKLPLAVEFARQFNATLHLLSASEHKEDLDELTEQMNDVCSEMKSYRIKVKENEIRHTTLPEAIDWLVRKEKMDLVMIMSRPGFRWSDLWMSPKAKRIIATSNIPIISLRARKPVEVDL